MIRIVAIHSTAYAGTDGPNPYQLSARLQDWVEDLAIGTHIPGLYVVEWSS
jgi:hypothetical protein